MTRWVCTCTCTCACLRVCDLAGFEARGEGSCAAAIWVQEGAAAQGIDRAGAPVLGSPAGRGCVRACACVCVRVVEGRKEGRPASQPASQRASERRASSRARRGLVLVAPPPLSGGTESQCRALTRASQAIQAERRRCRTRTNLSLRETPCCVKRKLPCGDGEARHSARVS